MRVLPHAMTILTRMLVAGFAARVPVTHQDQGGHDEPVLTPGCFGSPRKPSVPHRVQCPRARRARTDPWFRAWRSSPGWLAMRAQPRLLGRGRRAIRSSGSANPYVALPPPPHGSLAEGTP